VALPNGQALSEQTRDFAAQVYAAVSQEYLDFRRVHCHETNPSLATVPPSLPEVERTEAGRIAEGALNLVPRAVRSAPLVRDLIGHLQWEVDIHSLTDRERLDLHNLTMIYLYGVQDGVQAWFVEWLVGIERDLQQVQHGDYYLAYPWHGLLYQPAHAFREFEDAVAAGNVAGIVHEMTRLANGLVEVLRDPLGTQPRLAFSGPDGERRRTLFSLKTSAGLALAAYLAYDTVHELLHPAQPYQPPQSVIRAYPPQITARMISSDAR
jgi:hypothetical protein